VPSNLYRQALGSLSDDERTAFTSWTSWLEAHTSSSPDGVRNGAKVLENLQTEAHLVGDGVFGDPSELAELLRCCASRLAPLPLPERPAGYDGVCQEFGGRGLRVPREHLPDGLLRYSRSRRSAADLIERMLGKRARDAFDRDALPPETLFSRLRSRWAASRLAPTDRLGRGEEVFATFDHLAGAPRDDAEALSRALSLPLWQGPRSGIEILVEMSYPTDAVADHRFPTVADAGWIHLFRPAPEEEPDSGRPETCCGWTEPLGPYPPQPEIVHDNAELRILSEPPRFVGSIP
jgi:hypothetical protein